MIKFESINNFLKLIGGKWKINDKDNTEDSGSNVNVFYFKKNKIYRIWIFMSTQDNPLK